jgi:glutamate racemase
MKIGIFDSGMGGEIAAERLRRRFPDAIFTVINDRKHLPYGSKTNDEIYRLTRVAIAPLIGKCDVLVIACNTATAAAIDRLRADFPGQKFVGYEPMIKPAVGLSKTSCIVVLATPATIASERYQKLVDQFGQQTHIFTPDCSSWANNIENGHTDRIELGTVAHCLGARADVIVLACTHYLALQDRLHQQFPEAVIIEPTDAVADRISSLIFRPQR